MNVVVGNNVYQMSRDEFKKLLQVAKEQVPKGIYAIEKRRYAELRNDRLATTQLKETIRLFRQQGYKVYANR